MDPSFNTRFIDDFAELNVPKEEISQINNYVEKIELYVRYGARKIDLTYCSMTAEDIENIVKILQGSNVTVLDFRHGGLYKEDMDILFPGLANTKVETLLMDDINNLEVEDLLALTWHIQQPYSTIKYLSLMETWIGTKELAKMLENGLANAPLTVLNLADNDIGKEGIINLANHIPNSQIRGLLFNGRGMGSEGFHALSSALKAPQTKLDWLHIYGSLETKELWKHLAQFKSLKEVGVSYCNFRAEAVREIHSSIFESNIVALELDFYEERQTVNEEEEEEAYKALYDLIRHPRLKKLSLDLSGPMRRMSREERFLQKDWGIFNALSQSTLETFRLYSGYGFPAMTAQHYQIISHARNLKELKFPGSTDLSDEDVVNGLCDFIARSSKLEILYVFVHVKEGNTDFSGEKGQRIRELLKETLQASPHLYALVLSGSLHKVWDLYLDLKVNVPNVRILK